MAKPGQETLSQTFSTGSDATFDYTCQPCSGDNKTLEALGFCVDCSELLCDECFRYHLKPSLTRHHTLLDIEEAKRDTSLLSRLDSCTEKCLQHSGEVIKYFCLDHDCIGCGVCITLDHRNCQGVQYIPEIATGVGNGEDFFNFINQLDMVLLQTTIIADTSRGNKLKSQDIFDKVLDEVKRVRKDADIALEKLEKDIETEAEKIKTMDMHKMDENIKLCDTIHKQSDILVSELKQLKQKGQYCSLFVSMTANKSKFGSLVQPLDDVCKANSAIDYLLQLSTQLENFLRQTGNLGQICRIDTKKNKARKVGEVFVKIPSDHETCLIRGMAMVASGRLAVADYNNKNVKLIDTNQCIVISEYRLPHKPWGIAATEETREVVVTLSDSCEIFYLRLTDDKLYKHKEMKTTSVCYGVACMMDRLLVSLTFPERLEIIDKHGNVLRTIVKNKNGEQLFDEVLSVVVDKATGTIYVPDLRRNTVTRLGLPGQVQGIYMDSQLKMARCVAVDKSGMVYVCGQLSKNIHQITPDCKKIRILLTERDGLDSPRSLCYDGNTDCLYVGQTSDKLLLFQLSKAEPELKQLKQKGQYCSLFVSMTANKSKFGSLVQPLDDVCKANSAIDYLLQLSTQLENFLRQTGNLGQICRIDTKKNKARKVSEVFVKIPSDHETCLIRGMAMVASGRLAVADYNNKNVKLIDTNQCIVISEYRLPHKPWGIAATEETREVVVTLSDSCEIFYLRLTDDKLYKHKEMKTTSVCYGVACMMDRLLVSLTFPERLEIIDKHGNVLRTIVKNKNGEQLFDEVLSVVVDKATGTIYVPDLRRNTVTRLGLPGQVQGIYMDSQLKMARCVAVDICMWSAF